MKTCKIWFVRHQHIGILTEQAFLHEPTQDEMKAIIDALPASRKFSAEKMADSWVMAHPSKLCGSDDDTFLDQLVPVDPDPVPPPDTEMLVQASGTGTVG
jgi:hypothetical protein